MHDEVRLPPERSPWSLKLASRLGRYRSFDFVTVSYETMEAANGEAQLFRVYTEKSS